MEVQMVKVEDKEVLLGFGRRSDERIPYISIVEQVRSLDK